MGINYNKEFISKDRRILTSGPRDRQIRQSQQNVVTTTVDNGLVAELRSQIENLQNRLANTSGGYTVDQVNELITKTVKEQTAQLKEAHLKEINSLKEIIKHKDEIISQLKASPQLIDNKLTNLLTEATKKIEEMSSKLKDYEQHSTNVNNPNTNGRPQMEAVFVDPIDRESSVERHLDVEDVSTHKKEQMDDKVKKLKNLLGSLPTKR